MSGLDRPSRVVCSRVQWRGTALTLSLCSALLLQVEDPEDGERRRMQAELDTARQERADMQRQMQQMDAQHKRVMASAVAEQQQILEQNDRDIEEIASRRPARAAPFTKGSSASPAAHAHVPYGEAKAFLARRFQSQLIHPLQRKHTQHNTEQRVR